MPGTLVLMGLNSPADVGRGVRFGVPDVDMTGSALEKEEDHALGGAEALAGHQVAGNRRRGGGLGGLPGEEVGKAEAKKADGADPQEFPARRTVTKKCAMTWYD